jgi:hypothetical protein
MIEVSMREGLYIVTLPQAVQVLTKAEFIRALRRGTWWHRRQALAQPQSTHHVGE